MSSERPLRVLFIHNRSVLNSESYRELLELEHSWIEPIVRSLEISARPIGSRVELAAALEHLVERENMPPSENSDFIARHATRDQFKVVVAEFAVDGLTEAQSFLPIISRVPPSAQMPLMRVFIDEFGCGNPSQAHSQFYRDLLGELGMPLDVASYLDELNEESYAFVNVFYWLTQRAPCVEYFLGALAYLEASVPFFFKCYADACARLGIDNAQYYTEHMHIDRFHAREIQNAIRETELSTGMDFTKVWTGVRLADGVVSQAFDRAVSKARGGSEA